MNISIKLLLASVSAVIILGACATGGIAVNAPDFQNKFASGNIRLTCKLECAGTVGAARQKMKGLYNNRLWQDLAKEVARVGFDSDQQYFYLGASAAGLGYRNAARTYFALANASPQKCGGSTNVCDGFSFPADINSWQAQLNSLDAKDAAAARDAAARDAAAKAAAAKSAQKQSGASSPSPSTPTQSAPSAPEPQQPKAKSVLDL
jgi:hypothetical protein